jgi:hypothetical protein
LGDVGWQLVEALAGDQGALGDVEGDDGDLEFACEDALGGGDIAVDIELGFGGDVAGGFDDSVLRLEAVGAEAAAHEDDVVGEVGVDFKDGGEVG